jgi:hypothetical protein
VLHPEASCPRRERTLDSKLPVRSRAVALSTNFEPSHGRDGPAQPLPLGPGRGRQQQSTRGYPDGDEAAARRGAAPLEITVQHRLRPHRRRCRVEVLTGRSAAIDTTTTAGKLVLGLRSPSRVEREPISERIVAGLASARARGRGGRPCYERRLLRPVRISLIRISGCSRAAKCPPLSASP